LMIRAELNPLYSDIVNKKSVIGVVTGRRGSGKSAFLYRVAEFYHEYTGDTPYVLGFPEEKRSLLPSYFELIEDVDDMTVAAKSYVVVDEGAIFLFARNFQSDINRFFSNLLSISRHYDMSILVATQSLALIDINILRMIDALVIRKYSKLAIRFERTEVQPLIWRAQRYVRGRPDLGYVYGYDFEFVIRNRLPGFWSEEISKIWRYMFEVKRRVSKQRILEMIYLNNPEVVEEDAIMCEILDVTPATYRKMKWRLYKKYESKFSELPHAAVAVATTRSK